VRSESALHKPTSAGYEATKELWQARHRTEMRLDEAVDLCRRCHQMAPFCFYNGNTFTAIIRDVVMKLDLAADQAHVVRSLAGHIVAGVATEEEERAFRKFCEGMRQEGA